MKTRWDSCNPEAGCVCLNLEMAKKSLDCLGYVVVYKLAHLEERVHNDRFRALMDQLLPHWRLRRDKLNGALLGQADWPYEVWLGNVDVLGVLSGGTWSGHHKDRDRIKRMSALNESFI